MRILFMGTPDFSVSIAKALYDNFEVVGIYTQPDKPVGRKKVLTPPPVKIFAQEHNIVCFQPQNLKNEKETIQKLSPDFIVVAAYGQILSKEILEIAPCINLHTSLLPKYRGASPIQSVLLHNDTFSGVTAMLMDEGLDSGDILALEYVTITDQRNFELFEELSKVSADLIIYVIQNFSTISPLSQSGAISTHCNKIKKEDAYVKFEDAKEIEHKFRAFYGWPEIYTDNFKLKEISFDSSDGHYSEGEILEINKESIKIGCLTGSLYVYHLQPHSKKAMTASAYVNGKRLKVGDCIL